MRYKVGDEVVLRDDLEKLKVLQGYISPALANNLVGVPLRVVWVDKINKIYYAYGRYNTLVISEDNIDHAATATLAMEDNLRSALEDYAKEDWEEDEVSRYTSNIIYKRRGVKINLTDVFGRGDEPSQKQMDVFFNLTGKYFDEGAWVTPSGRSE